ncbi:RHS repeat protein [Muricauda sp. SCSIO 64092]|uniref:RHS repeat domain-containing protein n=1 Tax=Allomuricauda sp. SCSIO 64092 TaxID=2908842 RepID=UPI001FF64272|nr:RHS repeat domain-containing protein [Muricauda sp. SCSIO 64092]UOY08517.1 RHS repeat protein [Muricauda sp. SCSIO 64092]
MKKTVTTIMVSLVMALGHAQEMPDLIPPSPEATALAKYVDIPVSFYNGTPDIKVPIHTMDLEGMSIPIQLSYHAKGILVEEIASRVGLGWTLNFGGVITRQIRGSADEYIPNGVKGYLRDNFYETFFNDSITRRRIYDSVLLGEQDLYPDSFMFNFLGYSGKFIFDQRTKLPIIQHFTDLKIVPTWASGTVGEISGWEVTTPDGYTLHFGLSKNALRTARDKENIKLNLSFSDGMLSSTTGSGSFNAYTAWYLMDITGPGGKTITFTYQEERPNYCRRSYDKVNFGTNVISTYFSEVEPVQNQISEIQYDQGKIKFRATTARQDLNNAKTLDKIEITKLNDSLIKSYEFNYTYTTAPVDSNVLAALAACDTKANKRLFLNSITINDKLESATLPPYQFSYNTVPLPHRFSNAQDTWGYYNGKNNGQHLTFFDYGATTIDREVDTLKSQAGMLTKIQLPTGGSLNYEYEHNRAIPPEYFKDLLFPDTNPTVSKGAGLAKDPSRYNGTFYESEPFTIGNIVGTAQVNAMLGLVSDCGTDQLMVTCPYTAQLIGPQTNVTLINKRVDMILSPGTYVIKVTPNTGIPNDHNDIFIHPFGVSVSWKENVDDQATGTELLFTSGNRIKKTVLNDAFGGTMEKEYEYRDPQGLSSGKVFSLPAYYFKDDVVGGVVVLKRKYGARPGSPLTYEQGNHEGYEYVTEHISGANGREGKTEYQFTAFPDSGNFHTFPYHLATDNEWMRGKPVGTKYYKKESQGHILIKEIKNNYRYGGTVGSAFHLMTPPLSPSDPMGGIYEAGRTTHVATFIVFSDQDGTFDDSDEHNEFTPFYLTGGALDLYSKEEITYDGASALTERTVYAQDYDKHYQLSGTETTTNNTKRIVTKTYYPANKSELSGLSPSASAALDLLQTRRPGQAVQVEQSVLNDQDTALSKTTTRTNFLDWGGNLVLPQNVQTAKDDDNLENRIEYLDYDAQGNLLEVSRANGPTVSYIWGYNKQYPIAKIENASYTGIASALGISESTLRNYNETHLASLNGLRTNPSLQNAMITTYTYDPLVGITSMTDPRGYTTKYIYDNFNRLAHIEDADGHMIEQYNYHYKN